MEKTEFLINENENEVTIAYSGNIPEIKTANEFKKFWRDIEAKIRSMFPSKLIFPMAWWHDINNRKYIILKKEKLQQENNKN